jgi:CRISPR type III-A-associated RAMP protein Csm4
MTSGLLVRLRPAGPWRFGPDSGERHRLGALYRSDALFSAVSAAMAELGLLEEWLGATALASPAPQVRFTSCFPWQEDTLFVVPPRSHWPAAAIKLRTKGASFIPVSLASALLAGAPFEEDRWMVDGWSRCLLPVAGKTPAAGPFRHSIRTFLAVDRWRPANTQEHRAACLEFAPNAGLWCHAAFSDEEACARWIGPVEGAFRLLADSGFGGRRSIGWGRATISEITSLSLADLLAASPQPSEPAAESPELAADGQMYWLLSLFCPNAEDRVDWTRGAYSIVTRGGRVESRQGQGQLKKLVAMVEEGSVLAAHSAPNGQACDVAPDDFPHPVYRCGWAVSLPIGRRPAT